MINVELKGKFVHVIKNGQKVEQYEVIHRFKDVIPKKRRVVFENLGESEQLERTFFRQDKDYIDDIVKARRSRSPKHIDHTRLPTT